MSSLTSSIQDQVIIWCCCPVAEGQGCGHLLMWWLLPGWGLPKLHGHQAAWPCALLIHLLHKFLMLTRCFAVP